ncbi:hypothetical protein GZH53_00700 [Flavihumibacter sp. R14]|nr:hypothetical protein [Flavihumibacter soli]
MIYFRSCAESDVWHSSLRGLLLSASRGNLRACFVPRNDEALSSERRDCFVPRNDERQIVPHNDETDGVTSLPLSAYSVIARLASIGRPKQSQRTKDCFVPRNDERVVPRNDERIVPRNDERRIVPRNDGDGREIASFLAMTITPNSKLKCAA